MFHSGALMTRTMMNMSLCDSTNKKHYIYVHNIYNEPDAIALYLIILLPSYHKYQPPPTTYPTK